MNIAFEQGAFEDFTNWASEDKKLYKRLVGLIKETARNPYTGLGKPELLKHALHGYWSRRINDEHRLVYKVEADRLIVISCKYHYTK
ncbi:MAG: Txe/YoeB family addiction module toxin [Methylovulum sp.]|jgi:toxin YoeB|nr:MAG: Txe/YoeB family addiction module toxin [Methylovulum sp.]